MKAVYSPYSHRLYSATISVTEKRNVVPLAIMMLEIVKSNNNVWFYYLSSQKPFLFDLFC